jgi:hypothetical protein
VAVGEGSLYLLVLSPQVPRGDSVPARTCIGSGPPRQWRWARLGYFSHPPSGTGTEDSDQCPYPKGAMQSWDTFHLALGAGAHTETG